MNFSPGRSYARLKRKDGQNPAIHPLYRISDRVGVVAIPVDYPVFSIPGDLVTKASNMAKQQVMSRIISQQQAFQGLVFAGEGRETLRMMRGAGTEVEKRYTDYLNDVKRRSRNLPRALNRRLDALANMLLTVNYGVLPLLNDIDSGARALATDYSIRNQHKLVYGEGNAEGDASFLSGDNVAAHVRTYWIGGERSRVTVVYCAMVGFDRQALRQLSSQNLGVSLSSFVPSLYELIPYSFLLDYFTNVNEIVNGYFWGRSGVKWSSMTLIQTRERLVTSNRMVISPNSSYLVDDQDFRPCSLTSSVKSVNRSTYYGDFVPSLEFELPGSATRVANIGALAVTHTKALRAVALRNRGL